MPTIKTYYSVSHRRDVGIELEEVKRINGATVGFKAGNKGIMDPVAEIVPGVPAYAQTDSKTEIIILHPADAERLKADMAAAGLTYSH